MGRFYGTKILAGTMVLENVPKLWQAVTQKWLKEQEDK